MIKKYIKMYLSKYNPLAINRRKRMRQKLKNKEITFLCPNCIGGILFHDLGIRFNSPTVNLMMFQKDFIKFVMDLDYYINKKLIFYKDETLTCPCAMLDDIRIHFTHYKNEEEAEQKWIERIKRIRKDNLFIFVQERDGITKEDMLQLATVKAKGVVVFSSNSYPDIPYVLQISKYKEKKEVGNILKKSFLDDSREYEKYFDFVKWFNESDGKSFDITPYVK